jgi:hypothetical protein
MCMPVIWFNLISFDLKKKTLTQQASSSLSPVLSVGAVVCSALPRMPRRLAPVMLVWSVDLCMFVGDLIWFDLIKKIRTDFMLKFLMWTDFVICWTVCGWFVLIWFDLIYKKRLMWIQILGKPNLPIRPALTIPTKNITRKKITTIFWKW